MIYIDSIKKSKKTLEKLYSKAVFIDVTSKSKDDFVQLSPFYPHGDIPVPFSKDIFSHSVEGIWQGLKVFEKKDIDISKFEIRNMSGLKRPVMFYGQPLGHRKGIKGEILNYIEARKLIYIPSYNWVLKNKTKELIEDLKKIAMSRDIVFLDYTTNIDIEDTLKPLSHASIIKANLDESLPKIRDYRFSKLLVRDINKKSDNNQTTIKFD